MDNALVYFISKVGYSFASGFVKSVTQSTGEGKRYVGAFSIKSLVEDGYAYNTEDQLFSSVWNKVDKDTFDKYVNKGIYVKGAYVKGINVSFYGVITEVLERDLQNVKYHRVQIFNGEETLIAEEAMTITTEKEAVEEITKQVRKFRKNGR